MLQLEQEDLMSLVNARYQGIMGWGFYLHKLLQVGKYISQVIAGDIGVPPELRLHIHADFIKVVEKRHVVLVEQQSNDVLEAGAAVMRSTCVLTTLGVRAKLAKGGKQVDVVGPHKILVKANDG
ncbi:hypothetical protein L0F63_006509 [Massospora cicadina]|nr:hypothetical protein L0F63_006509 [Massospora cicadina]